jgi:hypothetical protein
MKQPDEQPLTSVSQPKNVFQVATAPERVAAESNAARRGVSDPLRVGRFVGVQKRSTLKHFDVSR